MQACDNFCKHQETWHLPLICFCSDYESPTALSPSLHMPDESFFQLELSGISLSGWRTC